MTRNSASGATAPDFQVLPALCLATFVGVLIFIAPTPFLPAMARDLDVGVPLLGQIVSTMLFFSALTGLAAGPVADRFGHRRVIVTGLASTAACFLVFSLAPAYPALFLAALLGGMGNAAILGPSMAVAGTVFAGAAARRALGWTTASMSGGAIVGVPLMTAVAGLVGWRTAFLLTAIAVGGIAGAGLAWLPQPVTHPGGTFRLTTLLAAYRPLVRHTGTLRLYSVAALRAICWFGMLTYFGAFLAQRLHLTTGQAGLAYMFGGAGYFLGSLVAGGPLGRVPARTLLVGGNLVMSIFMGLAFSALLGPVGTVATLPLATFAGAFGWVAIVALLTSRTPAGVGTTMTLHGSLFNLGAAAGGAIGGLLLSVAGYEALAVGLPLFGVGSALLAWWPQGADAPPPVTELRPETG